MPLLFQAQVLPHAGLHLETLKPLRMFHAVQGVALSTAKGSGLLAALAPMGMRERMRGRRGAGLMASVVGGALLPAPRPSSGLSGTGVGMVQAPVGSRHQRRASISEVGQLQAYMAYLHRPCLPCCMRCSLGLQQASGSKKASLKKLACRHWALFLCILQVLAPLTPEHSHLSMSNPYPLSNRGPVSVESASLLMPRLSPKSFQNPLRPSTMPALSLALGSIADNPGPSPRPPSRLGGGTSSGFEGGLSSGVHNWDAMPAHALHPAASVDGTSGAQGMGAGASSIISGQHTSNPNGSSAAGLYMQMHAYRQGSAATGLEVDTQDLLLSNNSTAEHNAVLGTSRSSRPTSGSALLAPGHAGSGTGLSGLPAPSAEDPSGRGSLPQHSPRARSIAGPLKSNPQVLHFAGLPASAMTNGSGATGTPAAELPPPTSPGSSGRLPHVPMGQRMVQTLRSMATSKIVAGVTAVGAAALEQGRPAPMGRAASSSMRHGAGGSGQAAAGPSFTSDHQAQLPSAFGMGVAQADESFSGPVGALLGALGSNADLPSSRQDGTSGPAVGVRWFTGGLDMERAVSHQFSGGAHAEAIPDHSGNSANSSAMARGLTYMTQSTYASTGGRESSGPMRVLQRLQRMMRVVDGPGPGHVLLFNGLRVRWVAVRCRAPGEGAGDSA